jgi:histidinol dehydrogenase
MTIKLNTFVWEQLDPQSRKNALMRPALRVDAEITARVAELIRRVRQDGDKAIRQLTLELDGVDLGQFRVSEEEADRAEAELSAEARQAIMTAAANVSCFHEAQITSPVRVETSPGVVCERLTRPVGAVGLYVPAGSAPLPSTAIMLAVPAGIAGCPTRVMCTPPRADGRADPAVVVAARACGVTEIYKIGGAQAIAALAYGTETVPKVDKIFGPGNAWVTAAKKSVAADVDGAALDMPAGPSEVMVIADESADPRFVALDLLSQAEHGPDSQSILVCTDAALAESIQCEINLALPDLSRREIIEKSLAHAAVFLVTDVAQAIAVANEYAPEHLILQINKPRQYIDSIINAGSVFLGSWTPESLGDYCSGTNHVLPTYGFARSYSGLSVADFQKSLTFQEADRGGLENLSSTVCTLAGLEGLDAHAKAVTVRLEAKAKRTVA